MIQRFFSKFGLSTHLAVLAALPLALAPFLPSDVLAEVVLWLTAFAALWLFVEPSLRLGEHLSFARARVRRSMVGDLLFWFLVLLVVFACVRWLNVGIRSYFDPERGAWEIRGPGLLMLPGSVDGAGYLPFALALAVLVVVMGIRHGIGLQARTEFGLVGSFISGLGGIAAVGCASAGIGGADAWVGSGFEEAPYWPSFFGVWLVLGVAAGAHAEALKWGLARLLLVVALAGNTGGLLFFAPPLLAVAWIVFAVLVAVFSLCYLSRGASVGAVARNLSILVFGLSMAVFSVMAFMGEEVRAQKLRRLSPACALEPREADVEAERIIRTAPSVLDGRKSADRMRAGLLEKARNRKQILNRLSGRMWKEHPWSGAGIGAFGIRASFLAERADWKVIPVAPSCSSNGYWTFLAERGILGVVMVVILMGILLAEYGRRLVAAFQFLRHEDDADTFPFAVSPLVWVGPLCVAGTLVEAGYTPIFQNAVYILVITVPLVLSASAFPKPKRKAAAVVAADGDEGVTGEPAEN